MSSPADRRSTPRRRARDRIASLDRTNNPTLKRSASTANLVLLVEDDLRETALALGAIEKYLASAMLQLENPAVTSADLSSLAGDSEVGGRVDALGDSLSELRRRLGQLAKALR